jgi:hypothetical protein
MSEFLKPCSRLLLAHEQGFTMMLGGVGDPACAPCWVFVFPPLL